ncbi:hypothetical protein [Silvibacterium acidisoli]
MNGHAVKAQKDGHAAAMPVYIYVFGYGSRLCVCGTVACAPETTDAQAIS